MSSLLSRECAPAVVHCAAFGAGITPTVARDSFNACLLASETFPQLCASHTWDPCISATTYSWERRPKQGTQSPGGRGKVDCFQWCSIPRIHSKCEGCSSVCASIKSSPLVDYAGGGRAGAAPGVAGAHARGVVRQGRQLVRQLPALHQQEPGGLRRRLHLQGAPLLLLLWKAPHLRLQASSVPVQALPPYSRRTAPSEHEIRCLYLVARNEMVIILMLQL